MQGLADDDCHGSRDKQQSGQVPVKYLSPVEALVFTCTPSTCRSIVTVVVWKLVRCGEQKLAKKKKDPAHF